MEQKKYNITPFAQKVYEYTRKIPLGKISTYKLVAEGIGSPNASRAVGTALKNNPFAPHVPCHRVIKSNFELGSFMGQENNPTKENMLKEEGIKIENGKIIADKKYRIAILYK